FVESGHTHSSALKREASIKKLSKEKKLLLLNV
ncbi:MAG: endonuclease, partial [Porticoccaceae bacterium]|nr:endonuclease [Porticoccaceae bacterium]